MKAYLKKAEHSDIATFTFNEEQLRSLSWEDDHEFSYKGEMYDVIEKTSHGDKTVIRCISDKKETALIKDFQMKTKEQSSQKNNSLSKLLSLQFVATKPIDNSFETAVSIQHYSLVSESIAQQIRNILTPPPQAV